MKKDPATPDAGMEHNWILAVTSKNAAEDRVVGRRNLLAGIWAGTLLGLPEERRSIYALEVMTAGMMGPGPDDVVDKIAHDFTDRGIPIDRGEILVQLSKIHRQVVTQRKVVR